jgi:hypothetical protein
VSKNVFPNTPYFPGFQLTKPDIGTQIDVFVTMSINEAVNPLRMRINDLEREVILLRRSWWQKAVDVLMGGDGFGWQ